MSEQIVIEELNKLYWKGNKSLGANGSYVQSKKKMMDMTNQELTSAYEHCKTMLFNSDTQNPGRYTLLSIISDQKLRIGVELFLRYVEKEHELTRFKLTGAINEFLDNNKEALKTLKPNIEHLFSSIPVNYEKLPLFLILDGCLDRLGTFNKKNITKTFILSQGIWLTPTESKNLIEYDEEGILISRIDTVKQRLNLTDKDNLFINSKGLNYTQLRAMLNLGHDKKYRDLTTDQLETLRYRILFNLEEVVKKHINLWEKLMEDIEKVAEHKSFKIC